MAVKASRFVTIKGIKDGLIFQFNDTCDFDDLVKELRFKLEHTHQNILTGPLVHVDIRTGKRQMTEEQKDSLLDILSQKGNLLVRSFEEPAPVEAAPEPMPEVYDRHRVQIITGMVRSGQVLQHQGSVLFLGDVNAGGTITSTDDIYILGALRGMAHAGIDGNKDAVIAASFFSPTQLRIADLISRPPDEGENRESHMEFAYLQDGVMKIDKMANMAKLGRDFNVFKGV
ncbi:septum site-determining protein MinC [Paenibacillus sp. SGZ-1009]|uniref:septum site-determining protein MinC n=1 Tax=Paenibacillus campi TaxID=3106031 RepID=UPI002AFF0C86|nr:septum site-determining protein MinC [Paenibacillus sp. SGZ-1009]